MNTIVISALCGLVIGLVLMAVLVWDYQRAQKNLPKRFPLRWPHCPFCPPVALYNDARLYPEPATIAGQSRDGATYAWVWCRRCGAHMHAGRWHAPDPEVPTYRDKRAKPQEVDHGTP